MLIKLEHWLDQLFIHIVKMIVLISIHIEIMKPIELVGLGHWLKRVFDHIVGQIKQVSNHIEKMIVGLEQWLEKLFDYIVEKETAKQKNLQRSNSENNNKTSVKEGYLERISNWLLKEKK